MTERKDTQLARRRRDVKEVAAVQDAQPLAFVQAPITAVLASAQRIVATELSFMERDQQTAPELRMDDKGAKKLQSLVSALANAVNTDKALSADELADMDDDELEAELVKELEAVRARKAKLQT